MGEAGNLVTPGDAFVAAVEAIYAAAAAPSEWPRALQTIADCLHDVGAILDLAAR